MDFTPLIAKKRERLAEVEAAVGAPDLYNSPKRAQELLREHSRLKQTIATDKKAISDLEDEARRAGVPPGWLRS